MKKKTGALLCVLGVLLALLGPTIGLPQLTMFFRGTTPPDSDLALVLLLLVCGLCIGAGLRIIGIGLRMQQPTAEELLASDPRPPVVFLRSFKDDSLAVDPGKKLKRSQPWFVPRSRAEVALALTMKCLGPVVAIGRPGERMPQMGASRIYVPDEEWQAKIAEWTGRASLVIMMAHHATPGTHWEIRHAVASLPPRRLALYFPTVDASKEGREALFEEYKRNAGENFPMGLPGYIGDTSMIRFDDDWTPQRASFKEVIEHAAGGPVPKLSLAKRLGRARVAVLVALLLGLGAEATLMIVILIMSVFNS
jgi:hypothetical protein